MVIRNSTENGLTPMPAKQFAAEMIKHTYRKGFTLPDMPAIN